MNGDDGAKEDELDSMALLAHLAVRFAEKNALGVNFSVFGQLEKSASSSSNLSNARRAFSRSSRIRFWLLPLDSGVLPVRRRIKKATTA